MLKFEKVVQVKSLNEAGELANEYDSVKRICFEMIVTAELKQNSTRVDICRFEQKKIDSHPYWQTGERTTALSFVLHNESTFMLSELLNAVVKFNK